MKVLIVSLFLFIFFIVGCNGQNITVMSYNIHVGIGTDKKLDLDRIASVISKEKPDIVSLNEIETCVKRTLCVNQIEYLAQKTNMYYAFGPNLIDEAGCADCNAGMFGNAVLSRHKIIKTENHRLYRAASEEIRGCLEVEIEIEGKKIAFLSAHLDYHREEDVRNNQARDILKIINENDMPVIFAGDMNAYLRTDGDDVENAAQILTEKLYDTANANSAQKRIGTLMKGKRIDFIFVNKYLADSVCDYRVINYGDAKVASDHFPIVAKIKR